METETNPTNDPGNEVRPSGFVNRALNAIEVIGNKLPDPAALFLILLFVVWILSAILSNVTFTEIDPRSGKAIIVNSQLTGTAIATFLSNMVTTFTSFHPLGIVLVALLGVGVAEHTGFINASLKWLLGFTSKSLLTPMLILIGVISNLAADAGYVLVIPLGAVIFYSAGRHPLAGIAATFAGVSGGFSANFIPSSLDPLISGITQSAVQILDPARTVNPLSSWFFMSASCLLITAVGWYVTDKIIEPRFKQSRLTETRRDAENGRTRRNEKRGLLAAFASLLIVWQFWQRFLFPKVRRCVRPSAIN
jgi:aminobenzoyl-glutamate transport protein